MQWLRNPVGQILFGQKVATANPIGARVGPRGFICFSSWRPELNHKRFLRARSLANRRGDGNNFGSAHAVDVPLSGRNTHVCATPSVVA